MISTIFGNFCAIWIFQFRNTDHVITYAHREHNCASTVVNRSDKYNFWNFCAPFGFFNSEIPIIPSLMPTGNTIVLHSYIHLQVYDHNLTSDIHEDLSRLSTRVWWDYDEKKNDVEKLYHRVIWDKLTPPLRTQALIKIINESDSLRWIFNQVLIMFLIYWKYFCTILN